MIAGTARVRGPSTKEEKKLWDLIKGRREEFEEELAWLKTQLDDPELSREVIQREIEQTRKILRIIEGFNRRWG